MNRHKVIGNNSNKIQGKCPIHEAAQTRGQRRTKSFNNEWSLYFLMKCVRSYEDGEVSSVRADASEPAWSLNIKKGLLSTISLRIDKDAAKASLKEIPRVRDQQFVKHILETDAYLPVYTRMEAYLTYKYNYLLTALFFFDSLEMGESDHIESLSNCRVIPVDKHLSTIFKNVLYMYCYFSW